jgi:hypothetical protein
MAKQQQLRCGIYSIYLLEEVEDQEFAEVGVQ